MFKKAAITVSAVACLFCAGAYADSGWFKIEGVGVLNSTDFAVNTYKPDPNETNPAPEMTLQASILGEKAVDRASSVAMGALLASKWCHIVYTPQSNARAQINTIYCNRADN